MGHRGVRSGDRRHRDTRIAPSAGARKRLVPCERHGDTPDPACARCLLWCNKCQNHLPLACFAKNEKGFCGKRSACKACEHPRKYEEAAMRLYRAASATIGRPVDAGMTWARLAELGHVPWGWLPRYIGLAQHFEPPTGGLWELEFRERQAAPCTDEELVAWTRKMMNPKNVMICFKWPFE